MEKNNSNLLQKQNAKLINSFYSKQNNLEVGYQICKICFQSKNLIICYSCKSYYHLSCENIKEIPLIHYYCKSCENIISPRYNSEKKTIFDLKLAQIIGKRSNHSKTNCVNKHNDQDSLPSNKSPKIINKSLQHEEKNFGSSNELDLHSLMNNSHSSHKRIIKHRRKRITNIEEELKNHDKPKKSYLHTIENTNINYKRRKIKVGDNYNVDVEEFFQKIKYYPDEDQTEPERNSLKKVWTTGKMTDDEINKYVNDCRFFWNYRNILIESQSCSEFYHVVRKMKKDRSKLTINQRNMISQKIRSLKEFVKFGIGLNNHFEEMCLKILHVCKYSSKKAIFMIFRNFNPYLEEEEIGFVSDIHIIQKEILSLISDFDEDE